MTSTTETETKVETQTPAAAAKEENLPVANDAGGDAAKDGEKPAENASAPGSPTKKTGTLKNVVTAHKKDFEKDVVYLYQFVRSPTTPSLSACCLMVETWLRMSGIQYENIDHKLRYKSKRGQLPFIELNGKEIEESDTIIRELSLYFEKDIDDGLTPDQKIMTHVFCSMLNNHTGWIVRWWRYNHPQEFLDVAQLDIKRTFNSRLPNSILNFVFKIGFRKHLKDAVGYGVGRFSLEEVVESAKNDLKVLSDFLGTKDYFFGKEPRYLDLSVFSHLAQFIYVPFGGLKEWMQEECANLLAHAERVKTKYWSDWDEILSTLEMNTHLPKKEVPAESSEPKAEDEAKKAKEEEAKKAKEAKAAEKKRLAEEKKKEREEKKKKEKEEKERKKKEKEEAEKAAKEKAAAEAEAAKQAEAAKAEAAAAETPAADGAAAPAAEATKEAAEKQETAPNGSADAAAAKPEVTAE
ncbi:PREDICTED: failed axon connections-like [Rhagoletis zephyria]|uniref:failed axon connections-like n=1 Tax=Rhagoletis zephyria TaxID=28612 RepID=UPI00081144AE|nr:PREDICTED: failed axon connections-like [Rhagoletis zephyria]